MQFLCQAVSWLHPPSRNPLHLRDFTARLSTTRPMLTVVQVRAGPVCNLLNPRVKVFIEGFRLLITVFAAGRAGKRRQLLPNALQKFVSGTNGCVGRALHYSGAGSGK